jgi:hypothetical protein
VTALKKSSNWYEELQLNKKASFFFQDKMLQLKGLKRAQINAPGRTLYASIINSQKLKEYSDIKERT